MRKAIIFITICCLMILIAFPFSVSADAPADAWDTGYYDLWLVDSLGWSKPGNTAVPGDQSSYYQWFYTYFPFYESSSYTPPLIIYTYDGSILNGANPTYRYGLRFSTLSSSMGKPHVVIEYGRFDANGNFSLTKSLRFDFKSDYDDGYIVFCGWGMNSSGQICILVEVDGTLEYYIMANSPNGDRHLYAATNNFDDFYILGFNTNGLASQLNSSTVMWCHEYLMSQVENSTTYATWLVRLRSESALPFGNSHTFNLHVPKTVFNIGQSDWGDLLNPGANLDNPIGVERVFETVDSVDVDVSQQLEFVSDGVCNYSIYITQQIKQYYGVDTFEVSYNVSLSSNLSSGALGDYFLTYSDSFQSRDLQDRIVGLTSVVGSVAYSMIIDSESTYDSTTSGALIYERSESLQVDLGYVLNRGALFDIYLVSDGTGWATNQLQSDYLESLQKDIFDRLNQIYHDSVIPDFTYRPSYDLNFGDPDSIFDAVFSLPGILTLAVCVATFCVSRVVFFK